MTTELLPLRRYQRRAIESVREAWQKGQRPAVVSATGTGKTVTFSHLIAESREMGRAIVLVHRDELVRQAVNKLREVESGMRVGVVKAEENETEADVIVASVQTLRSQARRDPIKNVGLIVVDECHHAAAASYRTVLSHWPEARVVGFTATLSRQDSKSLGDVFDVVACRYDVLDAINEGWLCDVTGRMVTVDGMSLADVAMRAGDLAAGSLSDTLLTSEAQNYVVEAYTEHARNMPGIVFTPSVAATHAFTEAFGDAGYSVASVWGDMPSEDRTAALKAYSAGDLQILVNCQVLTEGFDAPRAQCAVIARPTTSPALYIQMVGRVLRPYPGKDRALVLDVVGASQDHKLATLADLSTRRISEVRPGESVMEAARREVAARNPNLSGYVVASEEVDLFHRSRRVWLQTHGGVWFIRSANAVVFLWPGSEPDRYHVGIRPLQRPGGRWVHKDLTLHYAMEWGEKAASDYAQTWEDMRGESVTFLERRSASWRNRPANPGQVQHAESLGIPGAATMTRGQVSDAIAIFYASETLDHGRKS